MANHLSPEELAKQVEDIIETASGELVEGLEAVEHTALKRLIRDVLKFDTDGDGNIIPSRKNLKRLNEIIGRVNREFLKPRYSRQVDKFIDSFDAIEGTNEQYFSNFARFKKKRQALKNLKRNSINQAARALSAEAVDVELARPLRDVLTRAVTTGTSIDDLTAMLERILIGGPDRMSYYSRYAQQMTHDLLYTYGRSYHRAIAKDLDLKFYLYQGGLIRDSRPFCVERNGKVFHEEEIKRWGNIPEWQGRNNLTTETSVFIYLGGYNCRHSLIPVDESYPPESVRERAREAGYIE